MKRVQDDHRRRGQFHMPWWLAACAIVAVALMFLWEAHEAHILSAVPYLLLLACPLIHIFMHRGHGCHGGHKHENTQRKAES